MSDKEDELNQKIEQLEEDLEASNKMIEDYNSLEVERENIPEKAFRLGYEEGFTEPDGTHWSQAIETKAWLNYKIEAKL